MLPAIRHRPVDVGPAAELRAEQDVDRVLQLVGKVDHRRIEDDQPRGDCAQRGQDGAENAGIDDRRRHRAALIDAEHDVAQRRPLAAVAHEPLGDDRAAVGKIVVQVFTDRPVPVDLAGARARGAARLGQAPRTASVSGLRSFRSRSSTTLRTTRRAVSRVFLGMTLLSESNVPTRWMSASTVSSVSGSSSICWRFSRSRASFCITCTTDLGK